MTDGATPPSPTRPSEPPAPGGPLVLTLPLTFVWLAVGVGLPAVALLLMAAAPRLAAAHFATAPVFALTHAATLGWGSMTIFGAAYQMSQTLLGQRLQGERWIPWQLALFTAGTVALVGGFLAGHLGALALGGSAVTVAAWMFVAIMTRTARQLRRRLASTPSPPGPSPAPAPRGRARGRWVHGLAMALATVSFGLVTAWGVVLALSLRYPFWPQLHLDWRGLAVHVALGFGGWFGLMVTGVSFRLIPVIHGTRPVSERRALALTLLVAGAVALAVAGALGGWPWGRRLAALLTLPAAVLYAVEVVQLLAGRRRRSPDLNVDHWIAVLAYGLVLAGLAVAWAAGLPAIRQAGSRPAVAAAVLFLGGWVTQAILGQLYKVTPFLMWYYRAFVRDVLAIPNLPNLYAPRAGRFALAATNAGVVLVAAAVTWASAGLAQAGAALFLAGALAASWMFAYSWIPAVLRRRLPFVWRRR